MEHKISCPYCAHPLTVRSPDSIHTKCSVIKMANSIPQANTCTNPECGGPFPLYWS